MNRLGQFAPAAVVAATAVATIGTWHPLFVHISRAGLETTFALWRHPEAGVIALLVLLLLPPTVGMLRAIVIWGQAVGMSRQLRRAGRHVELEGTAVTVIPGAHVALFTAGTIRPSIYVTEGAIDTLSPEELRAALLHELSHLRHGDTASRSLLRLVEQGFGWLRPIRKATQEIMLLDECRADEEALGSGARPLALATAILAASQSGPPAGTPVGGAFAEERLLRLLGAYSTERPRPTRVMAALAATLLSLPVWAHLLLAAGGRS